VTSGPTCTMQLLCRSENLHLECWNVDLVSGGSNVVGQVRSTSYVGKVFLYAHNAGAREGKLMSSFIVPSQIRTFLSRPKSQPSPTFTSLQVEGISEHINTFPSLIRLSIYSAPPRPFDCSLQLFALLVISHCHSFVSSLEINSCLLGIHIPIPKPPFLTLTSPVYCPCPSFIAASSLQRIIPPTKSNLRVIAAQISVATKVYFSHGIF